MKMYCISFTDRGEELAERLSEEFGAHSDRCNRPLGHMEWTEKAFKEADTIVFVGACGIAVRSIAPYVVSKVTDPAVIVIDECGKFVISLLSGHLGGANDMARRIASFLGSTPVITTATDRNDVFAVDEWSKRQNAIVLEPPKIKLVSSKILDGRDIKVVAAFDMKGDIPEHLVLADKDDEDADIELCVAETLIKPLHIVPQIVHLGIGCRRGTPEVAIEQAFAAFKQSTGLIERSVVRCASIDLKADEQGLKEFCEFHGWGFDTYSAEELAAAEGEFESSEFVKKTTGVDNVCERSAVISSGGKLITGKFAHEGVTFAAAAEPYFPDWRWKDE
ncbi:MAG: cobalamin biosynthesis protein [Eubacterium sp.]|nr:cobalamin biosynthesis protein [Eubacterium sp.]